MGLATDVFWRLIGYNHHLACVAKQVLQHADKAHFAKRTPLPKAPDAPGPNKKARLFFSCSKRMGQRSSPGWRLTHVLVSLPTPGFSPAYMLPMSFSI